MIAFLTRESLFFTCKAHHRRLRLDKKITTVLGMFFAGLGCFWRGRYRVVRSTNIDRSMVIDCGMSAARMIAWCSDRWNEMLSLYHLQTLPTPRTA